MVKRMSGIFNSDLFRFLWLFELFGILRIFEVYGIFWQDMPLGMVNFMMRMFRMIDSDFFTIR